MSKRLFDTEMVFRPWYRALPARLKCLWHYCLAKCDLAGVLDMDWELASFTIGERVSADDLPAMSENIIVLENGKLFLPKFIPFQYGQLHESQVHKAVLRALHTHGIGYPYPMPWVGGTPKDKNKNKDKAKDVVGGQGGSTDKGAEQENEKDTTRILQSPDEDTIEILQELSKNCESVYEGEGEGTGKGKGKGEGRGGAGGEPAEDYGKYTEAVRQVKACRPEFARLRGADIAVELAAGERNNRYVANLSEFLRDAANSVEVPRNPLGMLRKYLASVGLTRKGRDPYDFSACTV